MRGTMTASSPGLGKGTTITFRVPLHWSVEAAVQFDAEVSRISAAADTSGRPRNAAGGRTYDRYSSINGGEARTLFSRGTLPRPPCCTRDTL